MAWCYYGDLRRKVGAVFRHPEEVPEIAAVVEPGSICYATVERRVSRLGLAVVKVLFYRSFSRDPEDNDAIHVACKESAGWAINRP